MKCVNPQQSSRNLLSEIRQRLRQRFIFEVKADLAVQKFKQNDNNFAIAYYRFSSHSQNEASIDQQREQAHAWADAHGYKIIREYEDAAMSGTRSDRPQYQLMLSEVSVMFLCILCNLSKEATRLRDVHRLLDVAGEGVIAPGQIRSWYSSYSRNCSIILTRNAN